MCVLLEWSTNLAEKKGVALPNHFRPGRVTRFRAAIEAAEALQESAWPARQTGKRRKRDRDFERKVDDLLKAREQVASRLDIEGSLIAPRAVLEALAADEAKPQDVLLKWQRECLGMA